jgi:DNA-binding SARP family transcriptional activator
MLGALSVAPGRQLHRDEVVRLLWPKMHSLRATIAFHRTLHTLRHILEPELRRDARSSCVQLVDGVLRLRTPDGPRGDAAAFEDRGRRAGTT